jgi:two-component system, cell cycle response regulator CtrA
MRLLLIEDDPTVTKGIELMLTSEDIEVQTTELGQDGLDLGSVFLYDLILLDLNLPDMSGYEVLRSLRLGNIKTPVLILSGLDGTEHKVKGLGLGADDYLTKPFQSDELIARIRAILRRSGDRVESVIRCGDLTLKLDQKRAEMGRRDVGLTTKEYRMLELLAMRQGTPITKDMFLSHLYGGMDEPDQKIIDVFICKLRKKLMQASGGKDYIETIWGRGYVLRDPEPVRVTSPLRAVG